MELNASDPDGDALTYSIAGGVDASLFSLNQATGILTFLTAPDYEANASASGNNIYSVIIQVSDGTLDANQSITIYVTDVYETPPNTAPIDLNSAAPLTIAENQPVGTVVGEFNASDPDANATLTYHLVSGTGDGNNSLFTLDANGTLKTATSFDYESNASSYAIRVHAKDEFNATVEGNFTVMLTGVYEAPTDQTGGSEDNSSGDNNATQPGPSDSNGTNPDNIGTQPGLGDSNATNPDSNGTQVLPGDSNATNPDDNTTQPGTPAGDLFQPIVETGEAKKVSKVSATCGDRSSTMEEHASPSGAFCSPPNLIRNRAAKGNPFGRQRFEALPNPGYELKPGKKYYYRAFATNAQGTALGSVESFTTLAGPPSPSWINAQPGARRQLVDEPLVRELLSQRKWLGSSRTARLGLPHGEPDGRPLALETRPRLALDGQGNLSVLI